MVSNSISVPLLNSSTKTNSSVNVSLIIYALFSEIDCCKFSKFKTVNLILSVTSKPVSLRAFCILFTSSLATPSLRKSSEIVTSKATVNAASFATNQPSISFDDISTSERTWKNGYELTQTQK